jgi:hypothetical protein
MLVTSLLLVCVWYLQFLSATALNARLSLVAEAFSGAMATGKADAFETADEVFENQLYLETLGEDEDGLVEKLTILRELSLKIPEALLTFQDRLVSQDMKMKKRLNMMYSPAYSAWAIASVRKRCHSRDLENLDALDGDLGIASLKHAAFSLTSIERKLDEVEEVLSEPGYSLAKDAAIASLSVWRPQLACRPALQKRLDGLLDTYTGVFLEQRRLLGIGITSKGDSFSFTEFKAIDKRSGDIFNEVYQDREVGQLVRGLSGWVAFSAAMLNLDEEALRKFRALRTRLTAIEEGFVVAIFGRQIQKESRLADLERYLRFIADGKTAAITPLVSKQWLELASNALNTPGFSLAAVAKELIAYFGDEAEMVADRKEFQTLASFTEGIFVVGDFFDSQRMDSGPIHEAMLGNLAMWLPQILELETAGRRSLLSDWRRVFMKSLTAVHRQRNRLNLPQFQMKPGRQLGPQVRAFAKLPENLASRPFADLFFTRQEGNAMKKLSVYGAIIGGIGGESKAFRIDGELLAEIEENIF